jgi:hypothetical protein
MIMTEEEKKEMLIKKFGKLAPKVIEEIINALCEMYIYDNSEAYETRELEIKIWKKVKKSLKI